MILHFFFQQPTSHLQGSLQKRKQYSCKFTFLLSLKKKKKKRKEDHLMIFEFWVYIVIAFTFLSFQINDGICET